MLAPVSPLGAGAKLYLANEWLAGSVMAIRTSGAARGIRPPDPLITNEVLYQLSYCGDAGPIYAQRRSMASGADPCFLAE